MKKTVSTATALSTAIVIALGGIALSGQAASAQPVPIEQEAAAAPADVEPVVEATAEPEIIDDAPEPAVPADEPTAEPTDGSGPAEDEVPVVAEPGVAVPGTAVEGSDEALAARAGAFTLESPVQGGVYDTLGYDVVVLTDEVDVQVEVLDGAGLSLWGAVHQSGPRIEATLGLGDDAAADQTVTVIVQDAQGVVLGQESRTFRIEVPTSPAVTVSTPRVGAVVTTDSDYPGLGVFTIAGTGVPGSAISYRLEALSGQEGWGHDYDAPRIAADGTYSFTDVLPHGSWRLFVSQYVPRGDGQLGLEGPPRSRQSVPVAVEFALAAPAAAAPVVSPVTPAVVPAVSKPVIPVGVRVVPVAHRSDLASTGSSETTPWAGLAGMVLVGLGAATVLVTRRRASRG